MSFRTADGLDAALQKLVFESKTAFDWLIEGVDRKEPITFVPNPGNIGDALINLACFAYLASRFADVRLCAISDVPQTECVFVGGGGNLVEPLYKNIANFLAGLKRAHRLFLFPSTVQGYESLLKPLAPRLRCLCRESVSLAYMQSVLGPEKVRIAHDSAFMLGPQLRAAFPRRVAKMPPQRCLSFRNDRERAVARSGGIDIMGQYQTGWDDVALMRQAIQGASTYLLGFGEVHTDRLHCAILSAILGRQTVLFANSYFKNRAVFELSLSRLPNTRFAQDYQE
jgi:exopolysaccharide biosynthesis predicted pyruvyltransferase EpsI